MSKELLWAYCCDDVHFKRKDNLNAWVTADQVDGKMFASYPFFEFVPGTQGDDEPKRFGDFVIDIDTGELACESAKQIISFFNEIYGVEPEQWRVYLSGKKGVHLELPATILGTEKGDVWLPLAYKRLAKDVEGELQVQLDTSMYNKGTGKPYRQPNIMRETGTCKRQIDYEDLYEIEDEEDYRAACSEPGRVWQPEDTTVNGPLSLRIAQYLVDAGHEQEKIKNQKPFTDDERDRLALNVPPCIKKLAHLTDTEGTGATFNDVAIQLTAYAITSGTSESDFINNARAFISQYPSTSLDTQDKRIENCRARYRTMAANGNHHSCGGILALRFSGYECSECKAKPESQLAVTDILSVEDLEVSPMTLQIPDEVLDPGGLISLGMKALSRPGYSDIPQYNMPVVFTVLARAISGKMVCQSVWPTLYNIKIGPTSSGKTTSDNAMIEAIEARGMKDFYGATDIASGSALMRYLSEKQNSMLVIDEATSLFRQMGKDDKNTKEKKDALMTLFSKAGKNLEKIYADSRNSIKVERPCLTLTGNTTPVILEEITQEDFDTGLIPRVDFWCYDGPAPYRGKKEPSNPDLERFASGIQRIVEINLGGGNLSDINRIPLEVELTDECEQILDAFSKETIDAQNKVSSGSEQGIISRRFDQAIKYAMIYMAATRVPDCLGLPMKPEDLNYGIAVAKMLSNWKLITLREKMLTGEFHKRCEQFKSAIVSLMKENKKTVKNRRPTFKALIRRKSALSNWKPKEIEEVIQILEKRGEIKRDDSRESTAYFLTKRSEK